MSIRNRTKDVGLALLKLDKLPLKLRRKCTVSGSRHSSPEDANYEKCKHIIEKSFGSDREHSMRVSTIDKDERNDKLETIVEHPLVEAEPRIEGLDVPPKLFGTERFKQPLDRRLQKSFDVNKLDSLDEIASSLMNVLPSQIDSKLLDTCARAADVEKSRTYPIVENLDCDVPGHIKKTVDEFTTKEDKDSLDIDKYTNLTPLSYRSYDLHLESDLGQKSFKAEKSYPSHLDSVFKMSVKENSEQNVDLNMPINQKFVSYNMLIPPPLPANETSISSHMTYEEGVVDSYYRDRTMPSYMREKRMGNRTTRELTTLQDRAQENYNNYLSAFGSTAIHETLEERKIRSSKSKQEIPLSQLLKQVRQRNKIAQDMNKKKLKFSISPFLSKSTCLPPLDHRPRATTCPPRPCPPRKEDPPPTKVMPCPPPKKTPCPPPKKDPCPVKEDPCDPCKPPPPCPPPPQNPCSMYTGNKFKNTITLILCGFNPFNILRHAFGLPLLWNCSYNSVKDTNRTITTTSVANSQALRMKYPNESSNDATEDQSKIRFLEVPLEQITRDIEEVYFARSYEPWSPIPSWPMATKKEKKKLVCPKDGCKLPKDSPSKPCKEFPCSFNAADRKR